MERRKKPARLEDRIAERRAMLDDAMRAMVSVCDTLDDVRAVYVYGSYARNAVGPESDLDLLIVRDTELRMLDRALDLRKAVRAKVWLDLLVVNPTEFRTRMRTNSMGTHVLNEAVLVKQYDNGEHRVNAG